MCVIVGVNACNHVYKLFAHVLVTTPQTLPSLSTIKRHEEEAKQILGEKFYSNLNIIIYNLMDGSTYLNLTSEKNGPTVYQGMIARNYAENIDSMQDKSKAPCFQGKYYHDIFGIGHSKY